MNWIKRPIDGDGFLDEDKPSRKEMIHLGLIMPIRRYLIFRFIAIRRQGQGRECKAVDEFVLPRNVSVSSMKRRNESLTLYG